MSEPQLRQCSDEKCQNVNTTDVIACFGCKKTFHMKCYGLSRTKTQVVTSDSNLQFLCDKCLFSLDPRQVAGAFNSLMTQHNNLKDLKSMVMEIKVIVTETKEKQAPMSLFQEMTAALTNINNSLQTHADSAAAARTATTESTNVLREIQSSIQNTTQHTAQSIKPKPRTTNTHQGSDEHKHERKRKKSVDPADDLVTAPNKRTKSTENIGDPSDDLLVASHRPVQNGSPANAIDTINKKTFVLSNLHPSNTADKVIAYINKKLESTSGENGIAVFSMAPKDRPQHQLNYISFKIIVPDEIYETVNNASFWPQGSTLRAYSSRSKSKRQTTTVHLQGHHHA